MEIYKVIMNPKAESDLDEIAEGLAALSEQAALKYYDLIIGKIESLSEMPKRFPLAMDVQLRLRGYRTMYVKNYIVFYVIEGNIVEIRRILYARRQYEKLI
jgi:plasmid stabilization system protein ParE